jgi:PAS domain-containing protein
MKGEVAREPPTTPEAPGAPEALERRIHDLEAELLQREALLEAAFASSYDGLAVLSPEGIFLEINGGSRA